jgi:hypothetical protein
MTDELFPDTNKIHPKKIPRTVFQMPNSIEYTFGKDSNFKNQKGVQGKDPMTLHLTQEKDWSSVSVEYQYNSMGLRCPEVSGKSNRLLLAGGSLCLGAGLNIEDTFAFKLAEKLDADYINISSADSLTELMDPIKTVGVEFNPSVVVICDTRFIQYTGWSLKDFFSNPEISKEEKLKFQKEFKASDEKFLELYEYFLTSLFPNAKLLFLSTPRKSFLDLAIDFRQIKHLKITKDLLVDLSRDCVHPGATSHSNIANLLYTSIM